MPEYTREKRFKTRSEAGTLALAETIAEMFPAPRVVVLRGDLGAGKTMLVKGWVQAVGGGSAGEVTSPTFALIQEYPTRTGKVVHLDLYRLETEQEVAGLGLEELFAAPDHTVLIEWGDKFASVMQHAEAEILIEHLQGDERSFLIRWRDATQR